MEERNRTPDSTSSPEQEQAVLPSWLLWAGGGCFMFASMGGVALGIALSQDKDEKKKARLEPLTPKARVHIGVTAFKALAYGTALCFSVAGLLTCSAAYYFDAWTPRELTAALKRSVQKTRLSMAMQEQTEQRRRELEEKVKSIPPEKQEQMIESSYSIMKGIADATSPSSVEKEQKD